MQRSLNWLANPTLGTLRRGTLAALTVVALGSTVADAASPQIPALKWEKRSDWVDVKTDITPAAVGDGKADDTTALRKALAGVRDGSVLYLPPGTYRVTGTLAVKNPAGDRWLGGLVIGCGRDTRVVWDGPAGGAVFALDGVAYSRFVGFEVDGRGKAGAGFHYRATKGFQTEVTHRHLAFRGFTDSAVLLAEGEKAGVAPAAAPAPAAKAAPAAAPPAPKPATPAPAPAAVPAVASGPRVIASPLAKRIAEQAGLSLTGMAGSGPNGRIVKADVETAVASGVPKKTAAGAPVAAAPPAGPVLIADPHQVIKLSTMRKTIARRLTDSKRDIPHYYVTIDCELDALMALRQQLNGKTGEGTKLSVNDFVIRAAALALKKMPEVNAAWGGDHIAQFDNVDISIAVAIPDGLITPIIRKADAKGLATISNEMRELGGRAKAGKLKPEEYQGGGFSISNLGMFGVKHFTACLLYTSDAADE